MKKTQILFLLCLCVILSACGGVQTLQLNTSMVKGDLDLKVQMQLLPSSEDNWNYQQIPGEEDKRLDSLLIKTEVSELSLPAFVQQELNQLRLSGYEITDEHTKKSKKLIENRDASTILKTYRILNPLGQHLYLAQYGVDVGEKYVFLSYASETLSHRKAFVSSLNSLIF